MVGVGVTPPEWHTSVSAIDLGAYTSLAYHSGSTYFNSNAYFNGSSNWIYKNTAAATLITQSTGSYTFYTAPSGTAGDTITWTSRLALSTTTATFANTVSATSFICSSLPGTITTLDASGATIVIADGATYDVTVASGLWVLTDQTVNGNTALFIVGGGVVNLVSETGTMFVVSLTPAVGEVGVAYNAGTAAYRIKNTTGASVSLGSAFIRTRTSV
jgi:hypothetical protein